MTAWTLATSLREVDVFGDWYCQNHQIKAWRYLDAGGLRAALVWHRRAGKDDIALRWACKAAHKRIGNYWHMLPQAEQARKAIWDAINPHTGRRRIDEAFPVGMRKRTLNNSMTIEFWCGSIWQVVGSDNYNALVGSPPIGVTFSEWSLADPHAWAYMRPILRENGGWALFIYTPRGRNHGYSLYQTARTSAGWFHEIVRADQSGVFSLSDLEEEKRELISDYGREQGKNLFEQEYFCSFDAAILGSIYAAWISDAEKEGRVAKVPYDPSLPVYTFWDFGWSDATCIWFVQWVRGEIHIIDFYRNSGKDTDHYADVVLGDLPPDDPDVALHEHRKDWMYEKHYGPHDAANKTLASRGRSIGDLLYDAGISIEVLPAISQSTQISALRKVLDYCYFDEERCSEGVEALRSYQYKWDDKLLKLTDEPLHNWASHPSDALEVLGQVWMPILESDKPPKPRFLHEVTADEVFFPKIKNPGKMERV